MNAAKSQWGSTFHQDRGLDEDALEDSDMYVDLGEDLVTDLEGILSELTKRGRLEF